MNRLIPLWAIPLLILFGIATVALRLTIIQTSYEIEQVEKMINNSTQELERLQYNVVHLKSPKRLRELSKENFNLVAPRADQVVYLKDSKNLAKQ